MANEFVARNGIISKGDLTISGSLTSTSGSFTISGSTFVTITSASAPGIVISNPIDVNGSSYSLALKDALGRNNIWMTSYSNGLGAYHGEMYINNIVNVGYGTYISSNSIRNYYNNILYIQSGGGVTNLAGNVAIGNSTITSPLARLQVQGSGTTSGTTALLVQNSNASASLVVNDNGAVAIGQSTPYSFAGSNSLTVNGIIYTSTAGGTSTPALYIGDNGAGAGRGIYGVEQGIAVTTNNATSMYFRGSPNLGSSNYPRIGINVNPTSVLDIRSDFTSSNLLNVSSSIGTAMFISGSGNVGLGTNTPSRALEVYKGGLVDGSINGIRITAQHSSALAQAALEFYHTYGSSGLSRIATDIGSGGTNPSMYFVVNGTTIMKLANTGNVQIGTTTDAGYKLDVNGNTRINGNLRVNNILGDTGNLVIESANSAAYVQIKPKIGNTDGVRIETDQTDAGTTGEWSSFRVIGPIFSPTTGSRTRNFISITPTINQTGGANGITRGLYVSASIISASDWRAIETTTGSVLFNGGNVGIGTTTPTSRLTISGSAGTGSAIYAYKSGSTVLDIQGSQGQLFSVVDALSGSLMSVNDVSGLPILEVFSDDRVVMGTYGAPALIVTGSNTVISGSLRGRVVTLSTASATASMDCSLSNFFDLTLSGSMYLGVSNIQPGETINLRITQPATSGSLNYTSSIKFPNGLPYSASATSSVVDLISFISFDSSTLYATSLKNLI